MSTRKLLAREIVAFSDSELDDYLEQHQRIISVQDPEELPKSFIERLRDRIAQSTVAPSGTLDLDLVNSRLLADHPDSSAARASSASSASSETYRRTASPSPIEDEERDAYDELVRRGCRPAYPKDLIDDVFRDPSKHRETLAHFLTTPAGWENPIVFITQLGRWSQFRDWQHAMRMQCGRGRSELFLSEECWAAFKDLTQKTRAHKSLAEYAQVAKSSVFEHYGISYPFRPTKDPEAQDKLSTWLEYLVFKHCVSKFCETRLADSRTHYAQAWARLVKLGVLEPLEIESGVLTDNIWQHVHKKKEVELEKRMRCAEAMGYPATNSHRLPELKAEMQQVRARLQGVDVFLNETKEHRSHSALWKMTTDYHTKELPWVLAQVPVVWKETPPLRRSPRLKQVTQSHESPRSSTGVRKRKRASSDKTAQSTASLSQAQSASSREAAYKRQRIQCIS